MRPAGPGRTLRLAHRGDWRQAPENTIPALLAALALAGCDGVEFDVRMSRDGIPVLLHDETLARVQGRPERVDDRSATELEGRGIPRLEAVLAAVPERAFLDVELKGDPGAAVIGVLEAGRGAELRNVVVSSFQPAALAGVHRARPRWPLWLNAMDLADATLSTATTLGCRGVSVQWRAVDAAALGRARHAGLEVAAWTVRRRATFDRLARAGLVAVCVEAAALDG